MKKFIKNLILMIIINLVYLDVYASSFVMCHDHGVIKTIMILATLINIIKIIVPCILIFLIIKKIVIYLIKDNEINIIKDIVIKVIIALLVLFVPTITNYFTSLLSSYDKSENVYSDCNKCLTSVEYCGDLLRFYPPDEEEAPNRNPKTETFQEDSVNELISTNKLEIHFMVAYKEDDAILIRTKEKTIVIDTGLYENSKIIVPYLKDLGVSKIDAIIGSHNHHNHIQTQAALIENFKVLKAYYPDDIFTCEERGSCIERDTKYIKKALIDNNIPTKVLKTGDALEFGDIKIYVLLPNKIIYDGVYSQNLNSLVFILKYGETSYMFTGDIPANRIDEKVIVETAKRFQISYDVDVLKFPHHGNNYLIEKFVNLIKPEYIIVPNNSQPQYPNKKNKAIIDKIGAKMYRLSDTRNMVIISDGKKIDIKTNIKAKDYKW